MLTYLTYRSAEDPRDLIGYVEFFFFVAPMFILAFFIDLIGLAACVLAFIYLSLFEFIIITIAIYALLGILYLKHFSNNN